MHILHLTSAKSWRGGERQIANLIKYLKKQDPKIIQSVFCKKGSLMEEFCVKTNIDHETFSNRPNGALQLRKLIANKGVDLCHIHDSNAHTVAGVATKVSGLKTPMVLHRRVEFTPKSLLSKEKYNLNNIKKVICASNRISKKMFDVVNKPRKIVTVYDGVDKAQFEDVNKAFLRAEYDIDAATLIVGNASALNPEKDYSTFLRTARKVLDSGIDAVFVIVGEGAERANIEQEIKSLKLQGKVIMTGFQEDVKNYIGGFDIFLMTSKNEGLGSVILEAFALGVPVVSTRAGGITEIIQHHYSGMLAPKGDDASLAQHIKHIVSNEQLKKELLIGSRNTLKRGFTANVMAEKVAKIYDGILQSKSKEVVI